MFPAFQFIFRQQKGTGQGRGQKSTLTTVIRRREYGNKLAICLELVPILDHLQTESGGGAGNEQASPIAALGQADAGMAHPAGPLELPGLYAGGPGGRGR